MSIQDLNRNVQKPKWCDRSAVHDIAQNWMMMDAGQIWKQRYAFLAPTRNGTISMSCDALRIVWSTWNLCKILPVPL